MNLWWPVCTSCAALFTSAAARLRVRFYVAGQEEVVPLAGLPEASEVAEAIGANLRGDDLDARLVYLNHPAEALRWLSWAAERGLTIDASPIGSWRPRAITLHRGEPVCEWHVRG